MKPDSKLVISFRIQRGSSLSINAADGSALVTKISIIASIGGNLYENSKEISKRSRCRDDDFKHLRLSIGAKSLHQVANGVRNQ